MPGTDPGHEAPVVDRQPEVAEALDGDDARRPLVSIVVPVRNGEPFIREALRSALDQTMRDLEVVVVDNASTDGTLRVVSEIADDRVRVITGATDIGAGANWNRAVRAARGEYVKLLCADDVLEPSCLERQVAAFRAASDGRVSLVCARRQVIDDKGRRIIERGFVPRVRGRIAPAAAARRVARSGTNPIGEPAAVLFRKDDALRAGVFREDGGYVIDLDLWLRLLVGGDLFVIDESLARFRISPGSWSVLLVRHQAAQFRGLIRSVAGEGRLGLRRRDVAMASAMAELMATSRRVLYVWLAWKERRSGR
jgi:glycosyltransferase involved in cell wall biosynthesis